jgi:hypothetical protein
MIARAVSSARIRRPARPLAVCVVLGVVLGALAGCGAGASSTPTVDRAATLSPAARETGGAGTQANVVAQDPPPVGGGNSDGGALPPFFNALSPWNTAVTALPADPRSQAMLALAAQVPVGAEAPGSQGATGTVTAGDPGLYINTTSWAPTIVTEQGGVPTKLFCRQVLCGPDAGELSTALIPPNVNPDPRYEGWFTVIDRSEGVAYDLWRARRQADGSISYEYVKRWGLDGPGFSRPASADPQGAVSARGSGLPLFAGAILPGELRAGAIHHALAIAVPGAARGVYVQPASTTDGVGPEGSLPEGARIRVKQGVTLTGLTGTRLRYADVVLAALKKYGAIVVDRSTVPTLYAQRDAVGGLLSGDELHSLSLADFEVVQLPSLLRLAPEGETADSSATAQTGAVG